MQQRTMNETVEQRLLEARKHTELAPVLEPAIAERYQPFVALNTRLGDLPALAGNLVDIYPNYPEAIACIADEIDAAQHFVHLEYFALSCDEETERVFTAMERAVQRGVKVRVLMDHLGSRKYPHFKDMRKRLTARGIENHLMLPIHFFGPKYTRIDLRNHRKIVVVDGQRGFTGSLNMIKRSYFRKDTIYYDELVVRVTGPVVSELEAAFMTDWYAETGVMLNHENAPEADIALHPWLAGESLCQVLPSGSAFDNDNNLKLFTSLIHAARHTLVITNPYFVPDDSLMIAITSAAQRGVSVQLINSEAQDQFFVSHAQHSYYEELLKAGVNIYWYKAPILLHSKHMTIDDDIAVIGSSNLDMRSFQLNMEVTLICYDPRVVADLRRVEAYNLSRSREICLEDWQQRPLHTRFFEGISRLTSALQ